MGISAEALASELLNDPASRGYAEAVAAGNDTAVAALLNAPSASGPKRGVWATELTILNLLGPEDGEACLQGLEAAALVNPVVARAVRILKQASGLGTPQAGIDLGFPSVQAMLTTLAQANFITAGARETLAAAGTRLWSRAEVLGGEGTRVRHEEVAKALGRG